MPTVLARQPRPFSLVKRIAVAFMAVAVLIAFTLVSFDVFWSAQRERLSREVGQRDALASELKWIGVAVVESLFDRPEPLTEADIWSVIKKTSQEHSLDAPRIAESLSRREDVLGAPLSIRCKAGEILVQSGIHTIGRNQVQYAVLVDRRTQSWDLLRTAAEIQVASDRIGK